MSDTPKTGIELKIEQEAKELADVPKEPITKFLGVHKRCHICGQIYDGNSSVKFDTHIRGSSREACSRCVGGA